VRRTGEIGYFYLAAESAVATGVRRIEAYTGERAVQNARVDRHRLQEISRLLGSAPEEAAGRIARLLDERKQLAQEAKSAKRRDFRTEVIGLVDAAVSVADIKLIAARTEARTLDELKTFGDTVRDALKSGVGILFAEIGGKGTLLCVVTKDLVTSNRLHAGTIVKEVARMTGSSGGGGPRMAQAGVKDLKKVDAALAASKEIVANLLIKV
jgi:alanyl-tRNA synthetase